MAKVLLVEDDNNLREIFEMRLQAEGYETVTASDGEEALSVAMKEKPDLIIADVMMPKLSGFEMLETLRAAPEMNSVKVVMMTALGQAEDRVRGEKLGVVKYLVKSQVTLEDFIRVVTEVLPLGSKPAAASAGASASASTGPAPAATQSTQLADAPAAGVAKGSAVPGNQQQNAVNSQISSFATSAPANPPADIPNDTPQPAKEEGPMQTPPPPAPDSSAPALGQPPAAA